jgi:hypothetical protein
MSREDKHDFMKSEKPHAKSSAERAHFGGSVELVPPRPVVIEFITTKHLWGLPLSQLEYFFLGTNPGQNGKKTLPTDLLVLVFKSRVVFLFGWRLEFMLDPLTQGRVKRVHAEQFLGTLIIDEPWVSDIKIFPRYEALGF